MSDLEVEALSKRYPPPWRPPWRPRAAAKPAALDGVSFSVARGEILGLIGPNGAGKSSLLRILTGLLRPSEGRARICGLDVVSDRPRSRALVGVALGDDRGLSLRLSGRENLAFFGALYDMPERAVRGRIDELSIQFEAGGLLDRPARTLSTGERARLILMRAFLHRPRALLLDEVTRSLDPGAASRLREQLVAEIRNSGALAVWATHSLEEAERVATSVLVLKGGRALAHGPYHHIQAAADSAFAKEERAA